MTTKYCDHGLYGTPVAGGTVPTAAEDGNGKGKTAATMATLVITFTGIPNADEAVTIAGVTFTAKASGATGNQFNAVTDATTCATNLKNAINASTTNAVKPTGVIAATAPLRNVVNATSSAGVVTVYTRCAGSDWNSVTETTTLTNATISAQWSGGADGAWGYLLNMAAIAWPTSRAACAYGIWSTAPCYLGTLVAGDVCKVRSAKTLDFGSGGYSNTVDSAYTGTTAAYITYEIDDGTEWPADGSTPVLKFTKSNNGAYYWLLWNGGYYIYVKAKKYSNGNRSLVFENTNTAYGAQGTLRLIYANGCMYEHIHLVGLSTAMPDFTAIGATSGRSVMNGCAITWGGGNPGYLVQCNGVYPINAEFNQCEFTATAATVAMTLMNLWYGTQYVKKFIFNACKCSGFVTGSQLFVTSNSASYESVAFFRDCDFPNVTVQGPTALSGGGSLTPGMRGVYMSSRTGYRDFMLENPGVSFIEWRYQKGRPTLNARLLDGTTPWSIFAVPSTTAGVVTRNNPVELPTISKWVPANGDLTQAVRTIKVNFMLESTLTWNSSDVSVFLTYTDSDGKPAVKDSFDPLGSALTTSTASWSTTSWNSQTWTRYEFNVTTDKVVKESTEICATLRIHNVVTNVTLGMIVDPEIIVS